MKLSEEIYVMLLHNELIKVGGNPENLYKEDGDVLRFDKKQLVDMAKDLANQFDKNSENVIID